MAKILKKAKDIGKKAVRTTKKVAEKVAGAVDITCDNCGKLMKPGIFGPKRTVSGKEYQFCTEKCADHFVAKTK